MLTPSLNTVMTRLLAAAALLAALALAVALVAPAASAQGGAIVEEEHAENDTGSVITFTSTDPEGGGIDWDVTGIDADDFTIDDRGVLMFKKAPDYEKPTDRVHLARDLNKDGDTNDTGESASTTADNTYWITVRATEQKTSGSDPRALSTETHVAVKVTNDKEPGTVTMRLREPQVGIAIAATLSDPDSTATNATDITDIQWTWSVSKVTNPLVGVENHWIPVTSGVTNANTLTSSYTPAAEDVDKFLRAKVEYVDPHPDSSATAKVAAALVSEFDVHAADTSSANGSPGFDASGDFDRTVPESIAVGEPVGLPIVATDPNNDTLTYELDNDRDTDAIDGEGPNVFDVGHFSIDQATGQLYVKKTLDWDANPPPGGNNTPPDGKYTFFVRATDPSNTTGVTEVTVTATNANDAPVIEGSSRVNDQGQPIDDDNNIRTEMPDAPSELRVNEKVGTTYDGSPGLKQPGELGNDNVFTASDEDARGQIIWSLKGDDADDFVLTNTYANITTGLRGPGEPVALLFKNDPDYESPTDSNLDSVYKVTLVATDSAGGMDERPLTIFVDNEPEQGSASLSSDQPLVGTKLTASVSDPDNGVAVITWQWLKATSTTSGIPVVIPGATTDAYTPVSGDNGQYLFARATYTDITSNTDDPDTPRIDERTQRASADDPPVALVRNADAGDGSAQDSHKLYRVSATSTNAVRVGATDPKDAVLPEFTQASYVRTVAENAEVGTIVGEPVTVTSKTGITTVSYDLLATISSARDYFHITEHGQIKVREVPFPDPLPSGVEDVLPANAEPNEDDPVLDYEGTNTFTLTVTATADSDPLRTAEVDVTVNLLDLNESPYFDKASRAAVKPDNPGQDQDNVILYGEKRTNAIVQLAAIDPDGGSLRWEVTGDDADDFMIEDDTDINDGKDRVKLMFKSKRDFENPTDRQTSALNLNPVPNINGDNDTEDTCEVATTATAPSDNCYRVTVRATETTALGDGPRKAAELVVVVRVTNVNEGGTVSFDLLQADVDLAADSTLGGTESSLTASVSDLDNVANTPSWQWYRAKVSNPNPSPGTDITKASFTSEWVAATGAGAGSRTYAPNAADEGWHLLARATYQDGANGTNNTFAVGVTAYPVREAVGALANNSPDFAMAATSRSVPENTAVGMPVGAPVAVTTNEDSDVLTYSLDNNSNIDAPPATGTDLDFFSISATSGQIMVKKTLSAEATDGRTYTTDSGNSAGVYKVYVRVRDSAGEAAESRDEIEVTITATDVNEAPDVVGAAELTVDENTDLAMATNLYKRDEEDTVDGATWPEPIAGVDGSLFEYATPSDGIGRRLYFKSKPDFENPMDNDKDNVYKITIRVIDSTGLVGEKDVRVTVNNLDEPGKLVLTPAQPDNGMPVIATLTDPDGVVSITDWEWFSHTSNVLPDDATADAGATTGSYDTTDSVGKFLWANVHYRDGASEENHPVTPLDERNASSTSNVTETRKYESLYTADTDNAFWNSDIMLMEGTANAVRQDPDPDNGDGTTPGGGVETFTLTVYENAPSTSYVGAPFNALAGSNKALDARDTIGGPDADSFVFAEEEDEDASVFYDNPLQDDGDNSANDIATAGNRVAGDDKAGQIALGHDPVTTLDYEAVKNSYVIEITDPDAEAELSTYRVTINVLDVNEAPTAPEELRGPPPVRNVAPDFAATTTTRTVAENMATGTPVGAPVSATDADDDPITYSLGTTTDDMAFDISTSTGQLSTKAPLDYETKSSYSVTVTATDDDDASSSIMVTIMVTDVGLTNAYDVDESGVIESDEVLQAVADYFAGTINQTQVLEVVALYFAGLPAGS